jgi:hypothetical protein
VGPRFRTCRFRSTAPCQSKKDGSPARRARLIFDVRQRRRKITQIMTTIQEAPKAKKPVSIWMLGCVLGGIGLGAAFGNFILGEIIGFLVGLTLTAFLERKEKKSLSLLTIVVGIVALVIITSLTIMYRK